MTTHCERDENRNEEGIEITPEMIQAGRGVFRDLDAFDVFSDETLERLIVAAYEAMRTAADSSKKY